MILSFHKTGSLSIVNVGKRYATVAIQALPVVLLVVHKVFNVLNCKIWLFHNISLNLIPLNLNAFKLNFYFPKISADFVYVL